MATKKKHSIEIEGGLPPFIKGKYGIEWESGDRISSKIRKVKSIELNMRIRPGVNQPIVAVLKKNQEVQILGEIKEIDGSLWCKIRAGSNDGWVNQRFLTEE